MRLHHPHQSLQTYCNLYIALVHWPACWSCNESAIAAYCVFADSSCGGLALGRLPRQKGFIEAFYSFWYKGKSDSWRLLRSLATRLGDLAGGQTGEGLRDGAQQLLRFTYYNAPAAAAVVVEHCFGAACDGQGLHCGMTNTCCRQNCCRPL